MRHFLCWTVLLVVAVVLAPGTSAAGPQTPDKKSASGSDKKKDDKKTVADAEKKGGEKRPTGKLRDLRDYYILNRIDGRLGKVDDVQKLGIIVQQAYVEGKEVKTRDLPETEVPRADDLIVRYAFVPPQFDDKGRPKRLTKKDMDELRGPEKSLPGYAADVDSLKPGQMVTLFVGKKKSAAKNDPPAIFMVVITKEAS